MRPYLLLPVLASILVTTGCAGQLNGPTAFQPMYYSSGKGAPSPVPACSGPVRVVVADVRSSPGHAGSRFEEDKPTLHYPITLRGEAAPYIGRGAEMALQRAGSPGSGDTPSTLAITLTQLDVEEKTYHNAEYAGTVALEVALHFADAPEPCWRGRVNGSGTNYGKAASEINYQQTLNRALDKAMSDLMADDGLRNALCGRCTVRR